jgi:hypothetical protein
MLITDEGNNKEFDDGDMNEELEEVDSVCPSELNDAVLNEMLVGVAKLVEEEEIEDSNTGTGVVIVEEQR